MKYISIEYIFGMFPEDSFLVKLIKDKIDKAKESDYITIDEKTCSGCSRLIEYNDGHVECEKRLEHICIADNYCFKNTKDEQNDLF